MSCFFLPHLRSSVKCNLSCLSIWHFYVHDCHCKWQRITAFLLLAIPETFITCIADWGGGERGGHVPFPPQPQGCLWLLLVLASPVPTSVDYCGCPARGRMHQLPMMTCFCSCSWFKVKPQHLMGEVLVFLIYKNTFDLLLNQIKRKYNKPSNSYSPLPFKMKLVTS